MSTGCAGLRGRMSVYQVVADGLPADFPVLRSVDAFTGNLPQQLSSVIGREEVVGEVAELVRAHRLVTLTGVGGVGKTRLAVEVGAEVAGEFPDGVWMIELASVSDPDSVPAARSRRCSASRPRATRPSSRPSPRRSPAGQLLLVVDNCEHVLAAAGIGDRDDPRPVRDRAGRRHVTRERWPSAASRRSRSPPLDARAVAWPPTRSRCSSTGRGPCGPTSASTNRRPPTR